MPIVATSAIIAVPSMQVAVAATAIALFRSMTVPRSRAPTSPHGTKRRASAGFSPGKDAVNRGGPDPATR